MATKTKKLDSPPAPAGQLLKAARGSLPLIDKLPVIGGGPRGKDVPDVALELDGVGIDPARLAEYCKVCGFTLRDTVPATYPHILAFPLHLALMNEPGFPFGAVGLVHIANEITQHRPITTAEKLDLRVSSTKLEPHAKGRQFTIVTEAHVGGDLVWEGRSTTLRRGAGSGEEKKAGSKKAGPELAKSAEWKIGSDTGRRYGAVSGDRNPIHLHDLTAKPLGFPKAIVHGMWTKARCLAQLEGEIPDAVRVEVAFKLPILMPAKVEFLSGEAPSRRKIKPIAFAVRSRDGKPHLEGTVGAP